MGQYLSFNHCLKNSTFMSKLSIAIFLLISLVCSSFGSPLRSLEGMKSIENSLNFDKSILISNLFDPEIFPSFEEETTTSVVPLDNCKSLIDGKCRRKKLDVYVFIMKSILLPIYLNEVKVL